MKTLKTILEKLVLAAVLGLVTVAAAVLVTWFGAPVCGLVLAGAGGLVMAKTILA